MKTKVFVISVLALLVLAISFGEIFSAQGRPGKKFVVSGDKNYTADCDSINPDSGVVVIQHDSWAYTYYDEQQIGSMGRMIAVGPGGHRHFICQETRGDYSTYPRYITYNCKDPLGYWVGPVWIDGGYGVNPGYANVGVMREGREVVVYNRQDTPPWHSTLLVGDEGYICTGYFTNKYDLPDAIVGEENRGMWPKMGIVYDPVEDRDYIHIAETETSRFSSWWHGGYYPPEQKAYAYQRCYFSGNNLICESPGGFGPYVREPYIAYPSPLDEINYFDEGYTVSSVIACSPVSQKLAIVYTKPLDMEEELEEKCDVWYFESTNNGDDWFNSWPPNRINITNYWDGDIEFAYMDVAACYDWFDSLHIVWNTSRIPNVYDTDPPQSSLYHWSKATGISLIQSAPWTDTRPGHFNRNISKMSISAKDTIYHPGDPPYLFCTWTQFDLGDNSAAGYANGDIYLGSSCSGGAGWEPAFNLTNTNTNGCAPGYCLSEHWSSLAENMYDGDLHIQYVCDRDPGAAARDEGSWPNHWTDDDMMYLHVAQPSIARCGISYSLVDPPSFTTPPIKVSPDGSRISTLDLRSTGCVGGDYEVTDDHPDVWITGNASGYLGAGESKTVEVTIDCSAEGFIVATITVRGCIGTVDETIIEISLYAVCSHDYYECARARNTYILKDNSKLKLWVCSNSMESIWHKWIEPEENQQVVFAGGTFVATVAADDPSDTVIGRQDFRDIYTGARDTINRYCGEWKRYEEGCLVQKIHVENTYVWKVRFPDALRWYWIDVYKQIFMFHDWPSGTGNCPDWKKDIIVKYIWIKFSRPPLWWPNPGEYPGHGDIYLGHYADVDAPSDEGCHYCNTAGYDDVREMIWLHGWYNDTLPPGDPHPEYEDFYVGLAFTDPSGGVVEPMGMQCVRNDSFLWPQRGWGWRTDQFYDLITTAGENIHDPDSVVDRTVVLTSGMIPAGPDSTFEAEYILIEAAVQGGPGTGLTELQAHMDDARNILIPELAGYEVLDKDWPPPICGDCNCDGKQHAGDIVCLIGYVFLGESEPSWPMECRVDVTGNGVIDGGDVVRLIGYVFLGQSILLARRIAAAKTKKVRTPDTIISDLDD